MKFKRISLRFDLDRDDDRRAWEALHSMDTRSINREIISRINAKEQTEILKDFIQQAISEEFAKATAGGCIPPPVKTEVGTEEMDSVFDFLNSF